VVGVSEDNNNLSTRMADFYAVNANFTNLSAHYVLYRVTTAAP